MPYPPNKIKSLFSDYKIVAEFSNTKSLKSFFLLVGPGTSSASGKATSASVGQTSLLLDEGSFLGLGTGMYEHVAQLQPSILDLEAAEELFRFAPGSSPCIVLTPSNRMGEPPLTLIMTQLPQT